MIFDILQPVSGDIRNNDLLRNCSGRYRLRVAVFEGGRSGMKSWVRRALLIMALQRHIRLRAREFTRSLEDSV